MSGSCSGRNDGCRIGGRLLYHFARSRLGVGGVSEEGSARGTARFSGGQCHRDSNLGGAFKSYVFEEEGTGEGESQFCSRKSSSEPLSACLGSLNLEDRPWKSCLVPGAGTTTSAPNSRRDIRFDPLVSRMNKISFHHHSCSCSLSLSEPAVADPRFIGPIDRHIVNNSHIF